MKVLSVTWLVYDEKLEQFSKNYTGGGVVIKNICEYIGRKCESYLLIGKFRLPEMDLGHIHLVGTDKEENIQDDNSSEMHLRTMTNAFVRALKEIEPDIVNIHGLGIFSVRCIRECISQNIPYVYTEHLYIGLEQKIAGYERHQEWEKSLYSISKDIRIIVVSSGMKEKILSDFPQICSENITVIKNGTDFRAVKVENNLRQKYGLEKKKILLCVGTILERKNQCQIVRAFQLLPNDMKEQLAVLFCGLDRMEGMLQRKIEEAGIQEKLIYVGAVENEEMKEYYSIADGLIMPSRAEGLSIAALETIAYGLPVIMFSDSECAMDLNDEEVVCLAKERSDQELANAMIRWYQKDWDKNYITEYSKFYSMERMAEDYLKYYRERTKEK